MRTSAPKTCTVRQRRLAVQWQRLAFKLAHERFVATKGAVPLEELQGVALLALTRAAAWFNASRKCEFATLASTAIWRDLNRFAADWLQSYGVGKCSLDEAFPLGRLPADAKSPDPVRLAVLADLWDVTLRDVLAEDREAFKLHFEGLSFVEIGKRLGVSRMRVDQRVRRAKDRVGA